MYFHILNTALRALRALHSAGALPLRSSIFYRGTPVYRIDRQRGALFYIFPYTYRKRRLGDSTARQIPSPEYPIMRQDTSRAGRGVDASQLRRLTENQDRHMCQTYPGRGHRQAERAGQARTGRSVIRLRADKLRCSGAAKAEVPRELSSPRFTGETNVTRAIRPAAPDSLARPWQRRRKRHRSLITLLRRRDATSYYCMRRGILAAEKYNFLV